MKKLFFASVLVFALLKLNAQTQYDKVVFHPYDLSQCAMGLSIEYCNDKARYCDSCYPFWQYPCQIQGDVAGSNQYGIQGIAQPYHFDSIVTVVGIATKVNHVSHGGIFFRLMDSSFNELGSAALVLNTPDSNGYRRYLFGSPINIKDFYLAVDIPPFQFNIISTEYPITWSLYDSAGCLENLYRSRYLPWDTIFVGLDFHNPDPWATVTDTLIACRFEESPWLKKDNQWVRFADDPVYKIFQKAFIEFLPILKVVRADILSLPEEISNDNTIKLYPNPAENTLNIESQEIIKEIEFYDALGKKALAITLNKKETRIDISSLAKGNYIVNLITEKGKITKKLVVR